MKPVMHPDDSVAAEAHKLVYGDRNKSYSHPKIDYDCTAKLWSAILGHEVTAYQAALCMIAVKLSRASRNVGHRDSLVDICGYATCADEITQAETGIPEFVKKKKFFRVGARVRLKNTSAEGRISNLFVNGPVAPTAPIIWEIAFDSRPGERVLHFENELELI
jgi:Domain of unknown function (DUF6378)